MIEMIALLFAYQGVISFEDVGVKGVTNKEEADAYVFALYNPLWVQRKTLNTEKENCIKDNDLK